PDHNAVGHEREVPESRPRVVNNRPGRHPSGMRLVLAVRVPVVRRGRRPPANGHSPSRTQTGLMCGWGAGSFWVAADVPMGIEGALQGDSHGPSLCENL
ncbi:MAG: hypothetical protein SFV23_04805, partial [Planctomycetaceae bacterium]|nr:hypothetical protein [Planctomycetaceae bacterium]